MGLQGEQGNTGRPGYAVKTKNRTCIQLETSNTELVKKL